MAEPRLIDDSTLLARCRQGDDLAWEAFVRRYQGRVYSVSWHYLRDREEARDLAQEVFLRVWRKLDGYAGGDSVLPWLMQLTRNASIDRLRRRAARPPADDVPAESAVGLTSDDVPADRALDDEAQRGRLYRAIDQLTEAHREMILLKEIQGLKLEEISGLLGLPLGTVKSRSRRARVELAGRLSALDRTARR